ncbi:hypothetical protein K438DRAFT_1752049 [Mycena galopus ATCC 62051]|nr:hypothetical protein K438DRAFT_1752049 [Mycena galopus ATCC 62051]
MSELLVLVSFYVFMSLIMVVDEQLMAEVVKCPNHVVSWNGNKSLVGVVSVRGEGTGLRQGAGAGVHEAGQTFGRREYCIGVKSFGISEKCKFGGLWKFQGRIVRWTVVGAGGAGVGKAGGIDLRSQCAVGVCTLVVLLLIVALPSCSFLQLTFFANDLSFFVLRLAGASGVTTGESVLVPIAVILLVSHLGGWPAGARSPNSKFPPLFLSRIASLRSTLFLGFPMSDPLSWLARTGVMDLHVSVEQYRAMDFLPVLLGLVSKIHGLVGGDGGGADVEGAPGLVRKLLGAGCSLDDVSYVAVGLAVGASKAFLRLVVHRHILFRVQVSDVIGVWVDRTATVKGLGGGLIIVNGAVVGDAMCYSAVEDRTGVAVDTSTHVGASALVVVGGSEVGDVSVGVGVL